MTTKELSELKERNEARLAQAKEQLGSKWLLHKDNQIKRKGTNDKHDRAH